MEYQHITTGDIISDQEYDQLSKKDKKNYEAVPIEDIGERGLDDDRFYEEDDDWL